MNISAPLLHIFFIVPYSNRFVKVDFLYNINRCLYIISPKCNPEFCFSRICIKGIYI